MSVATMIGNSGYAPYLSDQTAIFSVVRDKDPFFGGAIKKLLEKLGNNRNITAKYGTADPTMVKSYRREKMETNGF
jgi:hypothetical protein